MPNQKPLYISSGTITQLLDTDGIKAVAIDTALAGTLSIGASTANAITIGKVGVVTTFPGTVDIQGTVNYIGGTEFTDSVVFQENVTFGDATAPVSSVVFAASTTIDSNMIFGGSAAHQINNIKDPTLAQDAATKKYVDDAIALIPATSPGSPVNSIQFNNAGSFGGSSSLQWNGSGGANALAAPIVSLAEGLVPTNTASFGKLWASSADQTLHFFDKNSIDYLVTPNTVATLTYAASVALDFLPSLPPLKSVTLTGDITFTTSNLLASRNISVRVVGDTVSRNLAFPAGWTWLGGATPTVLEANKTAILSLAAFSGLNTGIIASWSYDGSDVVTDVTASLPLSSSLGATPNISLTGIVPVLNGGTGQSSYVNGELLIGNTTGNTLTKSTLAAGSGVTITNGTGTITIAATGSGGTVTSVGLSGGTTGITVSGTNPITSSGTFTLGGTLVAANGGTGQSSYAIGDILYASGAAALSKLGIGAANTVLRSSGSAPAWGSVALATDVSGTLPVGNGGTGASTFTAGAILFGNGASAILEDAGNLFFDNLNNKLFLAGVATTNTHTINIGTSGTDPAFSIASGGRIHLYDGTEPTNGQLLIGDGSPLVKNFAKATLSAGSGVSIVNGAGSITISATGSGGTVTSVGLSTTLSGITVGSSPVTTSGTITLSGTLGAGSGGTGATTLALNNVLLGNGTSALQTVAPGTSGNVLMSDGTTWQSAAVPAATDYSVVGITTAVASKLAVQINGTAADASAVANARVAGIVSAANLAKVLGYVTATFDGTALVGGDVGKPAYLSTTVGAGTLTKTAPSASGEVVAELGIIQAVNSGTEAVILWQPKSITVL